MNEHYVYRIHDLPVEDRPRERLAKEGAQHLSNAELMAILIRVGVQGENAVQLGQRLLNEFGGLAGIHRASFEDVRNIHGIGEAKAAQIKAAIELGRRMIPDGQDARPTIHGPKDVENLVQYEMSALVQEELWVLCLDTRNQVLKIEKVYRGSLNTSMVRVGELFRRAIHLNAAAIIIVHNHPSGDPTPSTDDIVLTRAIQQAGKLLDIDVLDHIVIGYGKALSLKEKGLGFTD